MCQTLAHGTGPKALSVPMVPLCCHHPGRHWGLTPPQLSPWSTLSCSHAPVTPCPSDWVAPGAETVVALSAAGDQLCLLGAENQAQLQ